jgi:predicted chitinase
MYDPNKSKEVWFYYANQFYPTDIESITRCWNGGDRGMKKRSTKKYYQKVLKMMENIK